jgi:hypothetical protein
MTDPRITILRKLREAAPPATAPEIGRTGYAHAVLGVCYAIEESAHPGELSSAGYTPEELTDDMRIGEHLSATRRFFNFTA